MSAVFFFLLGFPLSKNPVRQFSAISLSIIWYFIWKTLFYLFPNTLIAIIVMTLLFDDKIQYKIYWGIIFIFAEGFINKLICTILFSLTDKLDKWCLFPIPHILDCTIFVIMILISFILKNYKENCINFIHDINFMGYAIIMSITVIDFFLMLSAPNFYYDNVNRAGRLFIVTTVLLLIIITIVMLILYFSLRHSFQKLRRMDAINQKSLELEKEQYLSLQQKNNDLRKFRHDFHNHILSLQELVQKEQYTELADYIHSLSLEQIQTYTVSVGNIIIDAIINHTISKLNPSVQFHYSGQFSKNCFLTDMYLCILFSNLLDNAAEAVNLCNAPDKEINLDITADKSIFILSVENSSRPYLSEELHNLQTHKADKKNHGFGLANIRDVVNKYHGAMDLKYEDGFFSVYISIQNLKNNKKEISL